MASSDGLVNQDLPEIESSLNQIYKIVAQDISPAKKTVRSLPWICKLLTTDINLKGSKFKACFEILNLTFEKFLSILIYSQDWNAVEAVAILLHDINVVSSELLSGCLLTPDKSVMKELATFGTLLNVGNLYGSLQWSMQHALESGSVLPLDILLRLIGSDYEKRNCTMGAETDTLLHLSCSGMKQSKYPLLPLWLLGWGIDPNTVNNEGKLPVDLLPEDSSIRDAFRCHSTNKWVKDLAYMDQSAVKQFLLQQFCTSGQWLDISELVGRLRQLTEDDYSATLLALERKRWNTACKALLDTVGVSTIGLSILKAALEECGASAKRDQLVSVVNSISWRLRYENIEMPYTQPDWLKALTLGQQSGQNNSGECMGSTAVQLLQSSNWFKTDSTEAYTSKAPKKSKKPDQRISDSSHISSSFEIELCDLLELNKNTAVFMPHSPSHIVIAADIIKRHLSSKDVVQATQPLDRTVNLDPENEDSKTGNIQASGHAEIIDKKMTSQKDGEEAKQVESGSFYKQQRKRRSKQRQRNISVSEETVHAQPKLQYKKKHRRRTKSSSDSLNYLEEDISCVNLEEDDVQTDTRGSAIPKKTILVIVPSGKNVTTSVAKLKSRVCDFTIAEHAGDSKQKVGLRKLLKSNQVVVSHLPAVRNSVKSKSFAVKDVSLLMFMDVCYSDDIFSLFPSRTEGSPYIAMIFREFPYRSDICSLESILRYVTAKLRIERILSLCTCTSDLLRILYPDVAYTSDVMSNVDLLQIVCILRGHMSTTFGTYGKIEGCLFIMNMNYSQSDFKQLLTEECLRVLPSSFNVHPIEAPVSRKMKRELFLLSNVADLSRQISRDESIKCNFSAFVTQNENEIRVETISSEMLSQMCIDQLHCQQYIRVV